ncbi:hypothetical protein ADICYQ_0144 [Cyclobacterium qasimii M12-11B]|uniref:Uncharacterized protein n=1 Tax=Cyclobacterium qasimii M12-11B TaxID=641524 RepID=S7X6K3_9BACT|nr:hypothetical protein ADICYQ_0144 [Cyclobacterium qasimii M12-11B]
MPRVKILKVLAKCLIEKIVPLHFELRITKSSPVLNTTPAN